MLAGAATTTWILAPEDNETSWQRALHVEWENQLAGQRELGGEFAYGVPVYVIR